MNLRMLVRRSPRPRLPLPLMLLSLLAVTLQPRAVSTSPVGAATASPELHVAATATPGPRYNTSAVVCQEAGKEYRPGEAMPGRGPCVVCACGAAGEPSCGRRACALRAGCKVLHRPDECCPSYQCDCEQDGRVYANGEKLVDAADPCKVCYCQGGEVVCRRIACFLRADCEPRPARPGRCCPEYDHCPLRGVAVDADKSPGITTSVTSSTATKVFENISQSNKDNVKKEITIKEVTPVSEIPASTGVRIKEVAPTPLVVQKESSTAAVEEAPQQSEKLTNSPSSVPLPTASETPQSPETGASSPSPAATVKPPSPEEEEPFELVNPAFPPLPDDLSVSGNHEEDAGDPHTELATPPSPPSTSAPSPLATSPPPSPVSPASPVSPESPSSPQLTPSSPSPPSKYSSPSPTFVTSPNDPLNIITEGFPTDSATGGGVEERGKLSFSVSTEQSIDSKPEYKVMTTSEMQSSDLPSALPEVPIETDILEDGQKSLVTTGDRSPLQTLAEESGGSGRLAGDYATPQPLPSDPTLASFTESPTTDAPTAAVSADTTPTNERPRAVSTDAPQEPSSTVPASETATTANSLNSEAIQFVAEVSPTSKAPVAEAPRAALIASASPAKNNVLTDLINLVGDVASFGERTEAPRAGEIEQEEGELPVTDAPPPHDDTEPTTRRPIIDRVSHEAPSVAAAPPSRDIEIIGAARAPGAQRRPTKLTKKSSERAEPGAESPPAPTATSTAAAQ